MMSNPFEWRDGYTPPRGTMDNENEMTFNLQLKGSDIKIVLGALDELPGKISRGVFSRINDQIAITVARLEAERRQAEERAKALVDPPPPPA